MRNGLRNPSSREPVFSLMQSLASRFRRPAARAPDVEEERRLRALAKAQAGPGGDAPDET